MKIKSEARSAVNSTFYSLVFLSLLAWEMSGGFLIFATKTAEVKEKYFPSLVHINCTRNLSAHLLHRHVCLWHPCLLPGGRRRSISGHRRLHLCWPTGANFPGVMQILNGEHEKLNCHLFAGCWVRHHDHRVLAGHLLLHHHRLDAVLSDRHPVQCARAALETLWSVSI